MIHQYTNTAPATTQAQVNEHNATCSSCECGDKTYRGGSYHFGSLQVCKHQAHQLARAFEIFEALETEKGLHVRDGFCKCPAFIVSGFNHCAHLQLLTKIQRAMSEAQQAPAKKEISQAEAEALFARFD